MKLLNPMMSVLAAGVVLATATLSALDYYRRYYSAPPVAPNVADFEEARRARKTG